MDKGLAVLVAIWTALIGLAMVAILISQKAQTSNVIQALTAGGANLITSATAPITGTAGSTTFPASGTTAG